MAEKLISCHWYSNCRKQFVWTAKWHIV